MHILVVGGGIGGLAAAIAFRDHHFEVTVLEAARDFRSLGGILAFTPNGTKLLDRWCPKLVQNIYQVASKADAVSMRHWKDGRVLMRERLDLEDTLGHRISIGARASYHELFLKYAIESGAKVVFGARVVSFHDEAGPNPYVITEKGEEYHGSVVVCFDGIKSHAREYVLGSSAAPVPSGYSCYRGFVSGKVLAADIETASLVDGEQGDFWLGDDRHITAYSLLDRSGWYYVLTRPDVANSAEMESYSATGKVKDVLDLMRGWDPKLLAALAKTEECLDWQICHRPRLASWTSKRGRLIIAGDAAHPVSPTAGQGATQCVEDAAVIAYCLTQSPNDISLALHVVEALRRDRVEAVYQMGEQQREKWHQKDATGAKYDKDNVAMKTKTFFAFDAEKDAAEKYEEVVALLNAGI